MRSFAYKNSVWKTSWYQKQSAMTMASKSHAVPAQDVKETPPGKSWPWSGKDKSFKWERKV
jgi:hypothetical protein